MRMALLMALQAAGTPAPPAMSGIDFDLAKVRPSETARGRCVGRDPDEIVVCGRRPGGAAYPLEEMARLFEPKPIVAEASIGGGAIAKSYVESVEMPNGEISKRIMIGVKLPF